MNRQQRRQKPQKTKKPNPRKQPRNQQDVDRARGEGICTGVEYAFKIALYILLDKHDAPAKDVQQLSHELKWAADKLLNKELSWSFVEKVLEENGVEEVRFTWARAMRT